VTEARPKKGELLWVDPATVERVKGKLLPPAFVQRLSGTFKALGDQTRIRILDALSRDELCVCDLAALLEMSSSAVSHQLRVLRDARLVKFRREGKKAYYSLDDHHVLILFEQGLAHVAHTVDELKGRGSSDENLRMPGV
jgi:ArsR family transcriptional regulator